MLRRQCDTDTHLASMPEFVHFVWVVSRRKVAPVVGLDNFLHEPAARILHESTATRLARADNVLGVLRNASRGTLQFEEYGWGLTMIRSRVQIHSSEASAR